MRGPEVPCQERGRPARKDRMFRGAVMLPIAVVRGLGLLISGVVLAVGLIGCAPAAPIAAATLPPSPTPAATPTPQPPEGPHARIHAADGRVVFVRLEVADTAERKTVGLSGRSSLAADAGMIFVYSSDHRGAFWMKDTWIPLSIAFLAEDGRILEIQDMEPNTEDSHFPKQMYRYALEVNRGFFENNGVKAGDGVDLRLGGR